MNKSELVDALAERTTGDKKAAAAAVDTLVDIVLRKVSTGEKVSITGFGVFEKRTRAARTARNPATGASIRLKKTSVPAFRAGTGFKNVVNGTVKLPKVAASKTAAATKTTTTRATATKPAARTTTARATTAKATTKAASGRTTAAKTTAKAPATRTTKAAAAKPAAKRSTKK